MCQCDFERPSWQDCSLVISRENCWNEFVVMMRVSFKMLLYLKHTSNSNGQDGVIVQPLITYSAVVIIKSFDEYY